MLKRSQELVNEHFEATARDWLAIYESVDVHSRLYQRRRNEVLRIAAGLPLPPGSRVLDAGCGPGLIAVPLAERGLEVLAIDSVPAMIEMTRESAAAARVSQRVVSQLSDVLHLPAQEEQFDLVIAVGVTEWIASLDEVLAELSRVLAPGGYMIVSAANPWSLQYLFDPFKNPLLSPLKKLLRRVMTLVTGRPGHALCYARSQRIMNAAIQRAGLHVVESRRFGFGPFTMCGRRLLSNEKGWAVHSKLQALADRGWPLLRSTAHVYIGVARK